MAGEWSRVRLGDVVDVFTGFPFKSDLFSTAPADVRLLRGDNIGQGRLRWRGVKRWPASRRAEASDYELKARDLVLAMDRPWIDAGLKYAVVRSRDVPSLLVQRVARLRSKGQVAQEFIELIIADPRFTQYVKAVQTGTAVPHISTTQVQDYSFELPPKVEQLRIARLLGTLDQKAESSLQIGDGLEEIAAALFEARFAAFIGHDDLVESEIGPVPRDWSIGRLAEIAKVTMGQSPPSSTYTSDSTLGPVMVQGKGAFGPRFPKREVFCTSPGRVADTGDLLMTVRAPVGDLNVCAESTCLGRGVVGLNCPYPGFLEFALRAGASRWRAREGGTIYSSVNKQQVEGFPIVTPPVLALEEFERAVAPIREKIGLCYREMETLSGLRSLLLPRLLSGSLRVNEKDGVLP